MEEFILKYEVPTTNKQELLHNAVNSLVRWYAQYLPGDEGIKNNNAIEDICLALEKTYKSDMDFVEKYKVVYAPESDQTLYKQLDLFYHK